MGRVDRSILRVATYELMFLPDIPIKVAINEAIEIAKRFGSEESPQFVNGVLDRVASTVRPKLEIEVVRTEESPVTAPGVEPDSLIQTEDDLS